MGSLYAPTVVTGIHQMYAAIDLGQIARYGVTFWLPLASAANVAQGAAALAVALKSKDKKIKSLALPSSLSAFMGITEPAIFGVNLRLFKPFIAGCIGGGCGALYASLVHLGAKGTGVTGIFGVLLCLDAPVQYLIEMAIAVGVAFALSFILYKDKNDDVKDVQNEPVKVPAVSENVKTEKDCLNDMEMQETEILTSPVKGRVIPVSQVKDATFAEEILGMTVAIEPEEGKIKAPCDGEILNIYETGHAVCMLTKTGAEILIHVGIDTVKLNGKGFKKMVSDGMKVHEGDVLIEMDMEEVKEAGYERTTMMILTNEDETEGKKLFVEKAESGTPIMELRKK